MLLEQLSPVQEPELSSLGNEWDLGVGMAFVFNGYATITNTAYRSGRLSLLFVIVLLVAALFFHVHSILKTDLVATVMF